MSQLVGSLARSQRERSPLCRISRSTYRGWTHPSRLEDGSCTGQTAFHCRRRCILGQQRSTQRLGNLRDQVHGTLETRLSVSWSSGVAGIVLPTPVRPGKLLGPLLLQVIETKDLRASRPTAVGHLDKTKDSCDLSVTDGFRLSDDCSIRVISPCACCPLSKHVPA